MTRYRTGLGLSEAVRKAKEREELRKVVARSSFMPPNGHFDLDYGIRE